MTLKEIINVLRTATDISEIMAVQENILRIFPIMRTTVNYDQRNYAHQYDLWNHSIHTVLNLPRNNEDDMLYLGALLHDIGKPLAQCRGKNPDDPYMHYYGHPEISKSLIQSSVIPELQKQGVQLSLDEQETLIFYVHHHDDVVVVSSEKSIAKLLKKCGSIYRFRQLMLLESADAKAHITDLEIIQRRIESCGTLYTYTDEALKEIAGRHGFDLK